MFEGTNRSHLFARIKTSPIIYLQTSFRTAPSQQAFNQKHKQEAQPVHHILPYIKQQSYFSVITYNLQTSAKERKKKKRTATTTTKKPTPKGFLTCILCEFELDTRIRSLLIRDDKKTPKFLGRHLFCKREVDAYLRLRCSSRMPPAQVGTESYAQVL